MKPKPIQLGKFLGRTPPHSLEAEMSLLGSMILDPAVIGEVLETVRSPEAFYSQNHQHVFSAVVDVFERHHSGDLVQINELLRDRGVLDAIGGPEYLATLANSVPSAVNAPYYAKIVRDKHLFRLIIEEAGRAIHEAYTRSDSTTPESVGADLAASVVRVTDCGGTAQTMAEALREFGNSMKTGETLTPTGIGAFDTEFGGIPDRGLVTILGVPASGKSSLAQLLAWRKAEAGNGVRVHSIEMGASMASASIASAVSGVPLHGYRRKGQEPNSDEWMRVMEVEVSDAAKRILFSRRNMNARDILATAAADRRRGVRVVLVDYIQNLERDPNMQETEAIAEACRLMQRISRELDMLVLMVSQPTAAAAREKRPLRASDGVGSGAIQQASDMMISVYRPAVDENPDAYEGMDRGVQWADRKAYAELHVVKNKFGPVGFVKAHFAGHLMRFSDHQGFRRWG